MVDSYGKFTIMTPMKELDYLLKKFRNEVLAVKLGVSSSTITKWKAGAVEPASTRKEKIMALYKEVKSSI